MSRGKALPGNGMLEKIGQNVRSEKSVAFRRLSDLKQNDFCMKWQGLELCRIKLARWFWNTSLAVLLEYLLHREWWAKRRKGGNADGQKHLV